jgi:hypothetical protein
MLCKTGFTLGHAFRTFYPANILDALLLALPNVGKCLEREQGCPCRQYVQLSCKRGQGKSINLPMILANEKAVRQIWFGLRGREKAALSLDLE